MWVFCEEYIRVAQTQLSVNENFTLLFHCLKINNRKKLRSKSLRIAREHGRSPDILESEV